MSGIHNLHYTVQRATGTAGRVGMMEALDWFVPTGCSNHDCQHALKWGMRELLRAGGSEDDVLKQLWVRIESLRDSCDQLHRTMASFIIDKLEPTDCNYPRHIEYDFWVCLGVDTSVADILADMRVRWSGG